MLRRKKDGAEWEKMKCLDVEKEKDGADWKR
jgi:hypothetical protein